jgi:hypothetical protein
MIGLSKEAEDALLEFAEKWKELLDVADELTEPYRTIARFVKSEKQWGERSS